MEKFLKLLNGNVELVNIQRNHVRTYWNKGDCIRVDWYKKEEESVQLQLSTGKVVIVNKNGNVVRTI